MVRAWARIAAALLLALAVAGAAPCAAAAPLQKLTLVIGGRAFFYIVHYIAQDAGFFKEEGLDVDTVNVLTGPQQVAAVMGGSADVAPVGLQVVVQAYAKGGDIVAVSTCYNMFPIALVVSNEGIKETGLSASMPIDEKVRRLHGLKIGITGPGSGTDDMVRALFLNRGMDPDKEVTILPLGTPDNMLAALQKGNATAMSYTSPVTEIAVSKGLGQIIIEPLKGEVPEFRDVPYIVLSTSRATLESKRPLIKAAVRAYTRAIKFVAEHREEARRLVRPYFTDMSADDAVFNAAFDKYVHGAPTSPVITPEQVQKTADLLSISKKQKVAVGYTDVVYPDLAREAGEDILGH
ncbi:MAG: ABC transporter substrate-binding protein [Alphaproteobacteria bacterium]|nr:ABC transporter substrate-binding protein [Alphaproteobacteria bacterium]